MTKVLSVVGTIVVVVLLLALVALRYWNMFGQNDLGERCRGRAGCKSFQCLAHARRGAVETAVDGYCTAPCERDEECLPAGLRCVVPSQLALDDLPALGRPAKLCQRVE